MQYANVLLDHRAGHRPLTYSIPADLLAHIAIGSVVRVPFGKATVAAVVYGFVRHVDPVIQPKLKSILEVIQTGAFVPPYALEAAHQLHQHYGFRFGETLFSLLPPFLKTRQKSESNKRTLSPPGFHAIEYQIPMSKRPELLLSLYERLKKKQLSLLVVVASKPSAEALAEQLRDKGAPLIQYPSPATPAKVRRFFESTDQRMGPAIIIGTRGAMIASLLTVGAIVIDEPWLPGHKSDTYPKTWSSMVGYALAKQRDIPLITFTSTQWQETHLLYRPTRKVLPFTGHRSFVERTNLAEIMLYFHEQTNGHKKRAIVFRPDTVQQMWCTHCQALRNEPICTVCHNPTHQFPVVSDRTLRTTWSGIAPNEEVSFIPLDALQQFTHFDSILMVNIDTLLTIVDYRMQHYLQTIIGLAQGQTDALFVATRNQAAWITVLQPDENELANAQTHDLPPYGLPVELTADKKTTITRALTGLNIQRLSPITSYRDGFRCVIHCRPPKIPHAWVETPTININPLPLYIEKPLISGTPGEKIV